MQIEFDSAKRQDTLEERGLDMADAAEVFEGDHLTVEDARFDYGETRHITVGFLGGADGGSRLDPAQRRPPHHQHEESQ